MNREAAAEAAATAEAAVAAEAEAAAPAAATASEQTGGDRPQTGPASSFYAMAREWRGVTPYFFLKESLK